MSAPSTQTADAPDGHAVHPVMVRAVTKVYGAGEDAVHALDGVTLDVRRGEMVALVGPSGCGKSTLLNLVGCVDLPSSGTVTVDGHATNELDDDRLTRLRRARVRGVPVLQPAAGAACRGQRCAAAGAAARR